MIPLRADSAQHPDFNFAGGPKGVRRKLSPVHHTVQRNDRTMQPTRPVHYMWQQQPSPKLNRGNLKSSRSCLHNSRI